MREVLGNDEPLWKWVGQYLVMKRASIEPNFHSLYAGFVNTINSNILYDTCLSETHRNIKVKAKIQSGNFNGHLPIISDSFIN